MQGQVLNEPCAIGMFGRPIVISPPCCLYFSDVVSERGCSFILFVKPVFVCTPRSRACYLLIFTWETKRQAEQASNCEDLILIASVAAAACDRGKSSRDAVYESESSIGSNYDSSSLSSSFDSGSSSGAGSF